MKQQKIIIIGGTSGIGKEMAILYALKNNKVGVTGRRQPLLQELETGFPQNIITACFDVTANDAILQIEALIKQLNGLDLLIYNAGYGDTSDWLDPGIERTTIQTNVTAFAEIVIYAFNYFVQKGYGQIAVTSSVSALRGNSRAPAYSASKAFMSRYAESLHMKAYRLKKDIVVTDVRPGFINTKEVKDHKRFWVASPQKAAQQIVAAIYRKKRIIYITKRWWIIAQLMKLIPFTIYRRFV